MLCRSSQLIRTRVNLLRIDFSLVEMVLEIMGVEELKSMSRLNYFPPSFNYTISTKSLRRFKYTFVVMRESESKSMRKRCLISAKRGRIYPSYEKAPFLISLRLSFKSILRTRSSNSSI